MITAFGDVIVYKKDGYIGIIKYKEKKDLSLLVVSAEYSSDHMLDLMDYAQEKEYQDILSKVSKLVQF